MQAGIGGGTHDAGGARPKTCRQELVVVLRMRVGPGLKHTNRKAQVCHVIQEHQTDFAFLTLSEPLAHELHRVSIGCDRRDKVKSIMPNALQVGWRAAPREQGLIGVIFAARG